MLNYVQLNQEILRAWESANAKAEGASANFAPDGIMYKGKIEFYPDYAERFPNGTENAVWANAPLRYLFISKDQNTAGYKAWDVRGETAVNTPNATKIPGVFHRNLIYLLHGLMQVSRNAYVAYDNFTNEEALQTYYSAPLARINVKKQAGSATLSNSDLKAYLERDKAFIIKQIESLDADILVCCGYSASVEGTGNLILNFLNRYSNYDFQPVRGNDWIYYDAARKKIAFNAWHLSALGVPSRDFYEDMMAAYKSFLQQYPQFLARRR